MKLSILIAIFAAFVIAMSCRAGRADNTSKSAGPNPGEGQGRVPGRVSIYSYEIVNKYPHDPNAFTQGLVFHQGYLYESTGLHGQSSLRKVDLQTGQVLQKVDVPSQYFGEGLAIHDGRAFQLTWQSQIAFIYDPESFQTIGNFSYAGEGWGLTTDGTSLIMSNGSNQLKFLDPSTFAIRRTLSVVEGSNPVTRLNELEYINGEIYANIWLSDRIVRIDPGSGRVTGWFDLSGLLTAEDRTHPVDVLNGIAYDRATDRLFVTGKLWPWIFEIRLKLRRTSLSR